MEKGETAGIALLFICKAKRIDYFNRMRVLYPAAFLFGLFLLMTSPVAAQQKVADSLRNLIKQEKNDTNKVALHIDLALKVSSADSAAAWTEHSEVVKLAEKTGNDFFTAQAHFLAGMLHASGQRIVAINDFEKALAIFSRYPGNKKAGVKAASCNNNLGWIHAQPEDNESALLYYLRAEELYLKYDSHNSDLARLYANISLIYAAIKKDEDGIRYSRKGLEWARKEKNQAEYINALYTYGGNLVSAKKGDEGLPYLDTLEQLGKELKEKAYVYNAYFLRGLHYYNTKQYRKAIDYYSVCLQMARESNFSLGIGFNLVNLAANEVELKQAQLAKAHLDSSVQYIDMSTPNAGKQMYFENYAEVYRQLGQYDKAFALKDSVAAIKDSIYQATNIRQTEFRQARFNYERRQVEIERLQDEKEIQALYIRQKNTLNYILIGSAVALLIISLLGYRNYRNKQKLQEQRIAELETEKQLTATEAVLKGEEQERTRLAKDLHDGLGGMLSGIKYSFNTMKGNLVMTPENAQAFERSMDMLDSSIREMRRVAHNMMPEALIKFGLDEALKDFCNDINQSKALAVTYQSIGLEGATIEQSSAITIYRIVQELLNNIMKHAAAASAIVQVSKTGDNISITVEDDGKGFDPVILQGSRGIGWTNIQTRVEYLKGRVDVQSEPGKGSSVHIELTT